MSRKTHGLQPPSGEPARSVLDSPPSNAAARWRRSNHDPVPGPGLIPRPRFGRRRTNIFTAVLAVFVLVATACTPGSPGQAPSIAYVPSSTLSTTSGPERVTTTSPTCPAGFDFAEAARSFFGADKVDVNDYPPGQSVNENGLKEPDDYDCNLYGEKNKKFIVLAYLTNDRNLSWATAQQQWNAFKVKSMFDNKGTLPLGPVTAIFTQSLGDPAHIVFPAPDLQGGTYTLQVTSNVDGTLAMAKELAAVVYSRSGYAQTPTAVATAPGTYSAPFTPVGSAAPTIPTTLLQSATTMTSCALNESCLVVARKALTGGIDITAENRGIQVVVTQAINGNAFSQLTYDFFGGVTSLDCEPTVGGTLCSISGVPGAHAGFASVFKVSAKGLENLGPRISGEGNFSFIPLPDGTIMLTSIILFDDNGVAPAQADAAWQTWRVTSSTIERTGCGERKADRSGVRPKALLHGTCPSDPPTR